MSERRAAAAAKPKLAAGRLIEVRGLDKTFYDADREIRVLRGLDLNVQAGEEIAIVGQSGTGKSTLLHIIGSLEEPTAGKVFFEGEDLFALDQKGARRIPQPASWASCSSSITCWPTSPRWKT